MNVCYAWLRPAHTEAKMNALTYVCVSMLPIVHSQAAQLSKCVGSPHSTVQTTQNISLKNDADLASVQPAECLNIRALRRHLE